MQPSNENKIIYDFLKKISFIFRKNKKLLIIFITISLLGSITHLLTRKSIWKGTTNIEIKVNSTNNTPAYLNFLLRSQLEVIKSEALLEPLYNFYKRELQESAMKLKPDYRKWKENLNLNLKRGTNIVEISFIDNDKKLVKNFLQESLSIIEFERENRERKNAITNLKNLETEIKRLEREAKSAGLKIDNFLEKKNIQTYPKLLKDNLAEEFILNNKLGESYDPSKTSKFSPLPNFIYSLKLKSFNSRDLVDFKILETEFNIAQQNYINSIISKNKLLSIINKVDYFDKFKDSITVEKINENGFFLISKNFLITILLLSMIIILTEKYKTNKDLN